MRTVNKDLMIEGENGQNNLNREGDLIVLD